MVAECHVQIAGFGKAFGNLPVRILFKKQALQQNLWVTQGYPIALKAAKTKRDVRLNGTHKCSL